MLNHTVAGPDPRGMFQVVYPTPGCVSHTVACECRTEGSARREADRLNSQQLAGEMAIQFDRQARGLAGVYPDLGAN